jgi:hypothetical protein
MEILGASCAMQYESGTGGVGQTDRLRSNKPLRLAALPVRENEVWRHCHLQPDRTSSHPV